MDIENIVQKNVSYLHARDPSILAWNRHGLDDVRINLAKELLVDDSNKSSPTGNCDDHIQVFLRIKDGVPFEDLYEVDGDNLICKVPEGSHALRNIKKEESMTKTYSFTKIFGPETKQLEIFNNIVKPKILGFINGRNGSLMTYGASGSGKTFTIVGTPEEPGLIPRALEYLFRTVPKLKESAKLVPLANGEIKSLGEQVQKEEKFQKSTILNATHVDRSVHIKTYKQMQERLSSETVAKTDDLSNISLSVWVSFAEIYNENIYDLLKSSPSRGHQRPKLRLGKNKGCCYIKDLSYIHVTSGLEAYQVLQYGLHNLNYAATSINSHSSRSHCIFTMKLIQSSDLQDDVYVSSFNFCDLAGSERVKKTMNVGERLKESNNINTSLLVLGRCISTIRCSQLGDHRLIPFRESKLTQLFQKALMGLEDITMIVNMNPSRDMFDESQHILNFSAIAKEILIEEQPKIVKPKKTNRFSQHMERKAISNSLCIKEEDEDEKDIEISNLKNIITKLYMELEQKTLDHKQELIQEKEYIRATYEEFIEGKTKRFEEQKAKAISKVKKDYEEKIQMLHNHYSQFLNDRSDVISIDSSSDEDDSVSENKSRETINDLNSVIMEQNKKIKLLEQELSEKEKMCEEVSKLKDQIRILREREFELTATLDEGVKECLELQSELEKLETRNKKLISEKLQLAEKVEELQEVVSCMHKNDSDSDDVESDIIC